MNLVLLLVVIAEICLGICCWCSPEALRWVAANLLTRADVIEAARKAHSRRLQFWHAELGLNRHHAEDTTPAMEMVQSVVRR